jgi:hypothetical protein
MKKVTPKQENFLQKCVILLEIKILEESHKNRLVTTHNHSELKRQVAFIYEILSVGYYNRLQQTKKLNSLRNLYRTYKNKHYYEE